jgi:hypothetical protein
MKKLILAIGAALLMVGCDKGASNDNYGTSTGTEKSGTAGTTSNSTANPNP